MFSKHDNHLARMVVADSWLLARLALANCTQQLSSSRLLVEPAWTWPGAPPPTVGEVPPSPRRLLVVHFEAPWSKTSATGICHVNAGLN